MASVRALPDAPQSTLARVAGQAPDTLHARLAAAGLQPAAATRSPGGFVGPDLRQRARILAKVLTTRASTAR